MSENEGWKLRAGLGKGCVTSVTGMLVTLVKGSESPRSQSTYSIPTETFGKVHTFPNGKEQCGR